MGLLKCFFHVLGAPNEDETKMTRRNNPPFSPERIILITLIIKDQTDFFFSPLLLLLFFFFPSLPAQVNQARNPNPRWELRNVLSKQREQTGCVRIRRVRQPARGGPFVRASMGAKRPPRPGPARARGRVSPLSHANAGGSPLSALRAAGVKLRPPE